MLDFFWVRLMGKTAGDTSVAGRLKDASDFAKRAIEQGMGFVPAHRYMRLMRMRMRLRCGIVLLRRMWGKIEEGVTRLAGAF